MQNDRNLAQRLMWVLWPAFLVGGAAEALFFSVFDPFDLHFFGAPLEMSLRNLYDGILCVIGVCDRVVGAHRVPRTPWEVNRCPLEPTERPDGCPKREDTDSCLRC